jgi:hypothetical protein
MKFTEKLFEIQNAIKLELSHYSHLKEASKEKNRLKRIKKSLKNWMPL